MVAVLLEAPSIRQLRVYDDRRVGAGVKLPAQQANGIISPRGKKKYEMYFLVRLLFAILFTCSFGLESGPEIGNVGDIRRRIDIVSMSSCIPFSLQFVYRPKADVAKF